MFGDAEVLLDPPARGAGWQAFLAAESTDRYAVHPPGGAPEPVAGPVTSAELRARGLAVGSVDEALAVADVAVGALAQVDLADEDDAALGAGAVAASVLRNRIVVPQPGQHEPGRGCGTGARRGARRRADPVRCGPARGGGVAAACAGRHPACEP